MPNQFAEDPVAVFRRNFHVNPFWEDDVNGLINVIGADHILFGSDYPHPEGLAEPRDYIDFLDGEHVSADQQQLILGANAERLLGLTPR